MRMRQKVCGKRYFTYARRDEKERWTDWTQTNDLDMANWHILNIRDCGFFAKLVDKKTKEVLISDREEKVS